MNDLVNQLPLNQTQFLAALQERGVKITGGTLSKVLQQGEGDLQVFAQLRGTRVGIKMMLPAEAVEIMAEFWPIYKEASVPHKKAPAMLQTFLAGGAEALVTFSTGLIDSPGGSAITTSETVTAGKGDSVLGREIAVALVQVAEIMSALQKEKASQRLLSAKQVCEDKGLPSIVPVFGLRVLVAGRQMWREIDIDKYIANLPYVTTQTIRGANALPIALPPVIVDVPTTRFVFTYRTYRHDLHICIVNDDKDRLYAFAVDATLDFSDPALRTNAFPKPLLQKIKRKWLTIARVAAQRSLVRTLGGDWGVLRGWEDLSDNEREVLEQEIAAYRAKQDALRYDVEAEGFVAVESPTPTE